MEIFWVLLPCSVIIMINKVNVIVNIINLFLLPFITFNTTKTKPQLPFFSKHKRDLVIHDKNTNSLIVHSIYNWWVFIWEIYKCKYFYNCDLPETSFFTIFMYLQTPDMPIWNWLVVYKLSNMPHTVNSDAPHLQNNNKSQKSSQSWKWAFHKSWQQEWKKHIHVDRINSVCQKRNGSYTTTLKKVRMA